MSVWKRELFKWNRSSTNRSGKESQDEGDDISEPLITIGNVDPHNADLKRLHVAAMNGRRKDLGTTLQTGIWIDFPNDAGQTALFVATLRGHYRAAELLLQNGANPNEKSDTGMTPVHVACLKANLRVLGAMLASGGDLRLHDNEGNSCLDWARFDPSPRKRMKMMEFLQKAQLYALNYSGDFLGRASSSLERQPSILQMLRGKVGSQMSLDLGQESRVRRVHSHGYGRVYYGGDAGSGLVSVIPLVTDNQLMDDAEGVSFESSGHFAMTAKAWNMTPVTVKRLAHRQRDTRAVDLLISEVEHISRLRHPNLLLLMGLCQTGGFDDIMLVFERVSIGSLHYVLHEKLDHLPMTYIRDIACQVCQAMLYVHGQNYLHCSLTSHAVLMVTMHQAKLGCFEYTVEVQRAFTGRPCLASTSPHVQHFYRWMSPELLRGQPPRAASDVFSFCCVLWEMITSQQPWKDKSLDDVVELHGKNAARLPLPAKSALLFQEVTERGLQPEPKDRPKDFAKLLAWLQGPLDKPIGWKPSTLDRVKVIHKESQERITVRHVTCNLFGVPPETAGSSSSSSAVSFTAPAPATAQSGAKPRAPEPDDRRSDGVARADGEGGAGGADATNNHSHSHQRSCSVADSWSNLDNSDDDPALHIADGGGGGKFVDGVARSKPGYKRVQSLPSAFQPPSLRRPGRDPFERSASSSFSAAAGRHQRYSRRTASLPWQAPGDLIRAGSLFPRLPPATRASPGEDRAWDAADRSSNTLPLVKPASHATDLREFLKGDNPSRGGTASAQTLEVGGRRKRKASPRRSLPATRSRSSRASGDKHVSRSWSAAGEMLTAAGGWCEGGQDVRLSVPGSVRTLTEQFQAYMQHHSLRQSILKGSMTPQGTLFRDLDATPARLRKPPDADEVPPEGLAGKDPEDRERDDPKGSNDSLTSVSLRDDSTLDEEDEETFPLAGEDEPDAPAGTDSSYFPSASRDELDVTKETVVARPAPAVTWPWEEKRASWRGAGRSLSAGDVSREESARVRPASAQRESRELQLQSDHDGQRFGRQHDADSLEPDHTGDGLPRASIRFYRRNSGGGGSQSLHNVPGGSEQHALPFLPTRVRGADISNHPFDFQDYYIDDDYTGGFPKDGDDNDHHHHHQKRAARESSADAGRAPDRSRPRTREHFWLDPGKKGLERHTKSEQQLRAEKARETETRVVDGREAGVTCQQETSVRKETWERTETTSIRQESVTVRKSRKERSPRGYCTGERHDRGHWEAARSHAGRDDSNREGGGYAGDFVRRREKRRLSHDRDVGLADEPGHETDAYSYRNDATDSKDETMSNAETDEACYRKDDQWQDEACYRKDDQWQDEACYRKDDQWQDEACYRKDDQRQDKACYRKQDEWQDEACYRKEDEWQDEACYRKDDQWQDEACYRKDDQRLDEACYRKDDEWQDEACYRKEDEWQDEACYRKEDQWLDEQLLEDYTFTYSKEMQLAEEQRDRQKREARFLAASQWLEERFQRLELRRKEKLYADARRARVRPDSPRPQREEEERGEVRSPRQQHAQTEPADNARGAGSHGEEEQQPPQNDPDNAGRQDDGRARHEGGKRRSHSFTTDDRLFDERAGNDAYPLRTSSRKEDRDAGGAGFYGDVDSPGGDQNSSGGQHAGRDSGETGSGREDVSLIRGFGDGGYDQTDPVFGGAGGRRSPQQDPDENGRLRRRRESDNGCHLDQRRQQSDGSLSAASSGSEPLYPEQRAGYASRDSSLSTVVESRVAGDVWTRRRGDGEDDCNEDDNDRTLVAAADDEDVDASAQRPCIILNLESSGQPGLQDSSDHTDGPVPTSATTKPGASSPPHQQTTLRRFYLDSREASQGYTTTLRVESSLHRPGSHRITQTARDTGSGRTRTVHDETVQADTLRTTMGIQ